MAKVLPYDNLELLLEEDGFKYYLFLPKLTQLFPKSGDMRDMNFLQNMRFLLMKKHGYRVYILADAYDEVLASIVFSSGAQYRFPFADKQDLIYGPSYTVPEHRGNGYASRLADKVMHSFEKDYKAIYGTVRVDNVASLKCMAKNGFENVASLGVNKVTRAFFIEENGIHYLLKYER